MMISVVLLSSGMKSIVMLPRDQTITKEFFINRVIEDLLEYIPCRPKVFSNNERQTQKRSIHNIDSKRSPSCFNQFLHIFIRELQVFDINCFGMFKISISKAVLNFSVVEMLY